jgi:putative alpha-1,2-mannosidase
MDEAAAQSQLTMFYTGIYHSLLLPRIHSDCDGEYLSFDAVNRAPTFQDAGYTYLDDFSQWDIYRATLPLQFFLAPELVPSMVRSLVNKADQGGWLPIFPGTFLLDLDVRALYYTYTTH